MVEEYTIRLLDSMAPLLTRVPPAYYVGTLVGVINTCIFYVRFGRGLLLFLPYLLVGTAAAIVGLTVGRQLHDVGPFVGEVNVAATTISTWCCLFVARSLRL